MLDLDGTLIYSLPEIANALNICLNRFGIRQELPISVVKKMIGDGSRVLVDRALQFHKEQKHLVNNKNVDLMLNNATIHKEFLIEYEKPQHAHSKLYDTVENGLKMLTEEKVNLQIATNKPQHIAEYIVDHNPILKKYFPSKMQIVGDQNNKQFKLKPSVEHINYCVDSFLKRLNNNKGVDKKNIDVAVVGDSVNDVKAGREFGAKLVIGCA